MRVVGLDVSRTVAEIAYLEGGEVTSGGRVELVHSVLTRWAATQLRATDHVVLEATGNTTAVVQAVRPHVARGPVPARLPRGAGLAQVVPLQLGELTLLLSSPRRLSGRCRNAAGRLNKCVGQ